MPFTLLLADDSVTIQRIIELTFASEDISVVAVSDGDHAIASLDHSIPDIVLADVGMPGRNGYEVSQYIKNSPSLAHVPVLLLTGAFEPVDEAKARDAGCDGILIKPFEPQLVVSRVKELLNKQPPATKVNEVDEYFEELDRAFATLSSASPAPAPVIEPIAEQPVEVEDEASPASRPSLADAFAALLAAERSANGHKRPTPTLVSSSRPVPSEEVIERVTRRVLEEMSDAVIRETVTEIVHATAERLVREEIERIKSNIK